MSQDLPLRGEGIATFTQYTDATARQVAREYGCTLAEGTLGVAWVDYAEEVIRAIAAGAWPTYRVWSTWPERFRADLARDYTVRTDDTTAARYADYMSRDHRRKDSTHA